MLLTETIKNSTSAIKKRRATIESKQHAETYARALAQLSQSTGSIKDTLDCANAIKESGIVEAPVIDEATRSDLLACINDCGNGISEMRLSMDAVRLLKSKGDAFATQIKIVWRDASAKYSDGSKGYLSMIGGLSSDPKRAKELADNITKTVAGDPSIKAVKKLVADVSEAKKIADEYINRWNLVDAEITDVQLVAPEKGLVKDEPITEKSSETEISDEDLKEMTVGDFFKVSKSKKISNNQLYNVMETNSPVYKKVEIDEAQRNLILVFCQRHRIDLSDDFYYLGNLQCEHKFSVFNIYGSHTTSSYLGSDSEKEKYKCIEELVEKIQEYNQVMEYFENIDSLPCVSLQIENQGNTFDEDIDIKLFIEKDCFVDVDDIPKPGLLFLEEAVEIKIPKYLFCGHNDADIKEFSNYPVSPYIPRSIMLPFISRDTKVVEQQEEYQDLIENIFCYEIRKNEKEDIICFNIPYLKQNVKMFFPSYLFFSKIPQNIRYEIRSKLSPKVYRGTFTILNGEG